MKSKGDNTTDNRPQLSKLSKDQNSLSSGKQLVAKTTSTIDSKNQVFTFKTQQARESNKQNQSKSPLPIKRISLKNQPNDLIKDNTKKISETMQSKATVSKPPINLKSIKYNVITKKLNTQPAEAIIKDTSLKASLKSKEQLGTYQDGNTRNQKNKLGSLPNIKNAKIKDIVKSKYNSNQEKTDKMVQDKGQAKYLSNDNPLAELEESQDSLAIQQTIQNMRKDKVNMKDVIKLLTKNKSKRALNTSVPVIKKQNKGKEVQDNKLNHVNFNLSFEEIEETDSKAQKAPTQVKTRQDIFMLNKDLEIDQIRDYIKNFMKNGQPLDDFKTKFEFYDIEKIIGKGETGKVYLATHKLINKKVAIKTIEKTTIKNYRTMQKVFNEVDILASLSHENIVQLLEIFENSKFYFFVTEFCKKGDLHKLVSKQGTFQEVQIFIILKDLLCAIEYLHSHGIFHRDIKLDNILLTESYKIKLCDFGISKKVTKNDILTEKCGTPAYLSPEIIKQLYYPFYADVN